MVSDRLGTDPETVSEPRELETGRRFSSPSVRNGSKSANLPQCVDVVEEHPVKNPDGIGLGFAEYRRPLIVIGDEARLSALTASPVEVVP